MINQEFLLPPVKRILTYSICNSSWNLSWLWVCTNKIQLSLFACFSRSTAVGVKCKDGIVFGVEKLVTSKLYEVGANKRIFHIDTHVGIVSKILIHTVYDHFSFSPSQFTSMYFLFTLSTQIGCFGYENKAVDHIYSKLSKIKSKILTTCLKGRVREFRRIK